MKMHGKRVRRLNKRVRLNEGKMLRARSVASLPVLPEHHPTSAVAISHGGARQSGCRDTMVAYNVDMFRRLIRNVVFLCWTRYFF